MADEKKPGEKTIEMRLAEIEDKLAKLHITEEEMQAYNKVSGILGSQMGAGAAAPSMDEATIGSSTQLTPNPISNCIVAQCISQCIIPRNINRFINRGITPRINRGFCNECNCGPCSQGGGGFSGGGDFGGFGF